MPAVACSSLSQHCQ